MCKLEATEKQNDSRRNRGGENKWLNLEKLVDNRPYGRHQQNPAMQEGGFRFTLQSSFGKYFFWLHTMRWDDFRPSNKQEQNPKFFHKIQSII